MDRLFLSPPHMSPTERRLLLDAFDSNWVAPLGPHVDAFERELCDYVGVPHGVALCSGTAALHLALVLQGVGRGDDVFVSTLTFVATANAIRYVGVNPVFIDSERATWNMDPDLLRDALAARSACGRLPKAVIVVDLYGQCADYDRISAMCAEYDVPLIEDAAEALGASYGDRKAGAFGTCAAFSFNGNKIITCSGGGMLVCSSADTVATARHLATQARDPAPHYEHSAIGYNYRLSNLLAAVGRGQLTRLDSMVAQRRVNYAFYAKRLAHVPGVSFMPESPRGTCTRWLTCALIDEERFGRTRDDILASMAAGDIEARPVWKPMHLQPIFAGCEAFGGSVAADLFRRGICLPSGSGLTPEDRERVVGCFLGPVDLCPPTSHS